MTSRIGFGGGAAVLAVALALLAVVPAQAARPFSKRYGANLKGDITLAANTLVTCQDSTAGCAAAQQSQALIVQTLLPLRYVDIDSDVTTPNSSAATLTIPAGASVTFAGLYWGGRVPASFGNDPAAASTADLNDFATIKLDTPATPAYQAVTADTTGGPGGTGDIDGNVSTVRNWQGFADVTGLVQAGGSGEYTVADVAIGIGAPDPHDWGGWTLVVAYSAPTGTLRNVTVFDGLVSVPPSQTINLSGFVTPATGAVSTTLGAVAYEGDPTGGGTLSLFNGAAFVPISDAVNPVDDFFNSGISRYGVNVVDKNPNYVNQSSHDAKLVLADGIIPNGATSTGVQMTSTTETYFPGVFTTSIGLPVPDVTGTKTVTNITSPGQPARVGETLEYELDFRNGAAGSGADSASQAILRDAMPAGTSYLPGSLTTTTGAPAPIGARTDASGDDSAEFIAVQNEVVFRVGSGANAVTGGTLAAGDRVIVRFRVKVDTSAGPEIVNTARATFRAVTANVDLVSETPPSTIAVRPPLPAAPITGPPALARIADVEVTKAVNKTVVTGDEPITWTIRVTNHGPSEATGVVVRDQPGLPITLVSASTTGGTCTQAAPVTCTLGTMAPGSTVTITLIGAATVTGTLRNVATVTTDQGNPPPAGSTVTSVDPQPANNVAAATTTVRGTLRIEKTANKATVRAGRRVGYTIKVTNPTGIAVRTVRVCDRLPAGMVFVSSTPKAVRSGGRYCWRLQTVAARSSKSVELTTRTLRGTRGKRTNTATLTGRGVSAQADAAPVVNVLAASVRGGGVTG